MKQKTQSEVTVNESKHTPTPWTVTNSNNSDYLDIDGTDARICSIPVNEVELNEQGVTRAEAEANAQRIVTAVNNHDAMLEALNLAFNMLCKTEPTSNDNLDKIHWAIATNSK